MDAWAREFEGWAICDTACFCLFARVSPSVAMGRARAWSRSGQEFVKRGAFALVASLALHAKALDDAALEAFFPMIDRGARDDRNFVKKGVSWALRALGKRRPGLRARAIAVSRRLAASEDPSSRWVGKDALRDLSR